MSERRFGGVKPDAIVTMGADGSSPTPIRTTCVADPCLGDNSPAWSPDGNRLVFERAFGPIVEDSAAGLDLVTANADGSGEQLLLPHFRSLEAQGTEPHDPQWSPDGRRIVFNSSYEGQGAVEIYTVRPDGSRLRRLRREPKETFSFEPVWSPDGRRIAFVHGTSRTVPHIWAMKRNGRGLRRLTHGPKPDLRPDWGSR